MVHDLAGWNSGVSGLQIPAPHQGCAGNRDPWNEKPQAKSLAPLVQRDLHLGSEIIAASHKAPVSLPPQH